MAGLPCAKEIIDHLARTSGNCQCLSSTAAARKKKVTQDQSDRIEAATDELNKVIATVLVELE